MTRMHARRAVALERDGVLLAPQPGWFRPGNGTLGTLDVLGSSIELALPAGVAGIVTETGAPRAVAYGDPLGRLVTQVAAATAGATTTAVETQHGPVFRSPTSGRYYGRSSPDKPAFVTVGMELAPGATVCLLEVMKTFNRVTYDGERARVRELLVADGADVNAGDPLLALEPI